MKIAFIIGTRPEAIKLSPLILEMKSRKEFDVQVYTTGQHKELVTSVLKTFDISPNIAFQYNPDPNIFNHSTPISFISYLTNCLEAAYSLQQPDYVVVQGDTTSAFIGALVAFYHKIKVIHVEAGLRTWDNSSPHPEEAHRSMISRITDIHFCATEGNKENLNLENITENIHVVGNTGLDAIKYIQSSRTIKNKPLKVKARKILLTLHRRESFGPKIISAIEAINHLTSVENIHVYFPMHPNPNLRKLVKDNIIPNKFLHLLEPLGYGPFVNLMTSCDVILTDSGGIQEEAPFLGKYVVVVREKTERSECIGKISFLVGFDKKKIINTTLNAFALPQCAPDMSYGDGESSSRIVDILVALP